jgi:hypothetical protein
MKVMSDYSPVPKSLKTYFGVSGSLLKIFLNAFKVLSADFVLSGSQYMYFVKQSITIKMYL